MGRLSGTMNKINNFFLIRWIRWIFVFLLTIPIKIYQWIISPALPRTCRYHPSCSEYALESLRIHGPVLGLLLGTKRILSCNPWGGHGHDPVPPKGTPLPKLFNYGRMNSFILSGLVIVLLASCRQGDGSSDKPVISVSVLPQQYFIEQIAGNRVEVNVMVPSGASPATYEPTASQLAGLEKSLVYMRIGHIGFELSWMDKIKSVNPSMHISDLSEGIDLIHENEDHHVHGHNHGGVDPHIWMSPVNAKIIARNIYKELLIILPDEQERLTHRFRQLSLAIDSLNHAIFHMLEMTDNRSFMIYHPALSYFARDYNLSQFPLETGGKTPSPTHMKWMADLGKEKNISAILIQEQFNRLNAEALAREIGAEIIQINPLDPDWNSQMMYIAAKLKSIL